MQKDEVIGILREMADLLEITDANTFEVMAHRRAAQALEDWYGDLEEAVAGAALTDIPSIGKGLSRLISDLVRTGSSDELVRVRSLVPPELPTLLRVRGLGPKRVRALWRELGVESPHDLRQAAAAGRVQALRGFGAKTVDGVLAGLDYLENAQSRPAGSLKLKTGALPRAPKSSGRLWTGMSGYSYPQWKGTFYPDDARPADFLELYAGRLATVEINNTFYHFPSQKVIAGWRSQTPAHFRFAIKVHRRITHQWRLGPAAHQQTLEFVQRCGELGARLGCILFQLPPDFARDDARLAALLELLPRGPRYAIEFRHESWFADEVQDELRRHNVACVSVDTDNGPPRRLVTADFVYARLRRASYHESELAAWDEWFRAQVEAKRDVLAYLKHDEAGTAPDILLGRWAPAKPPAAREIRGKRLAGSRKPAAKRGRRTG